MSKLKTGKYRFTQVNIPSTWTKAARSVLVLELEYALNINPLTGKLSSKTYWLDAKVEDLLEIDFKK